MITYYSYWLIVVRWLSFSIVIDVALLNLQGVA